MLVIARGLGSLRRRLKTEARGKGKASRVRGLLRFNQGATHQDPLLKSANCERDCFFRSIGPRLTVRVDMATGIAFWRNLKGAKESPHTAEKRRSKARGWYTEKGAPKTLRRHAGVARSAK